MVSTNTAIIHVATVFVVKESTTVHIVIVTLLQSGLLSAWEEREMLRRAGLAACAICGSDSSAYSCTRQAVDHCQWR